jgi:DNA ligase (NAD+)
MAPQICYNIYSEKMIEELQTIKPPIHCPTCSTTLIWEKDQLFCVNPDCSGKTTKKIEHFAKTLKIKGLGPRTVEKLKIGTFFDLYELPLEMMIDALQSEKLAVKLHREINASKSVDLVDLLPAFSIKLIGTTASQKVCEKINSLLELNEQVCSEAGLGPKAKENLLDWFYEEWTDGYDRLPFSWKTIVRKRTGKTKGIVCITGKLKSYKTKAAAKQILEKMGYLVKNSLTKDVTILINESGVDSAKTQAALDRGVQIITNLKEIL